MTSWHTVRYATDAAAMKEAPVCCVCGRFTRTWRSVVIHEQTHWACSDACELFMRLRPELDGEGICHWREA